MKKMRLNGWKKDKKDKRDYLYKAIRPTSVVVPNKVDLRSLCSQIEDQGQLGSCTANAIAGSLELLENKIRSKKCCLLQLFTPKATDISRLFVYYNERKEMGTVSEDSGAYLRDGIKTLNQYGWCPEKIWPYDISKFTVEPTEECYTVAVNNKISTYNRLESEQDRLECLATRYPFVFGIYIYKSFLSVEVARGATVPMPLPGETRIGGHAICAVGYDKSDSTYLCRNSWGEAWGMEGYFKIPFAYVEQYGADFWTIRK